MPSMLSTGTKRRAPPSWCKKGLWAPIPPLIAGMPAQLAVYARWKQKSYGIDIDVIESFQMHYDAATKIWAGSSSDVLDNVRLEITTLAAANRYDVKIELRSGTAVTDSHTWWNQTIPDERPFDTGSLEHVLRPDLWFQQVHAKG